MKKVIYAFAAGCLAIMGAATGVNAQNSIPDESLKDPKYGFAINKVTTEPNKGSSDLNAVNAKAIKDFKKTYKNVTGENWMQSQDGVMVRFTKEDVMTIVYYDKRGNWKAYLKGYKEDKLPFAVRDLVKRNYYDFDITYVDEVFTDHSNEAPTYIVHLEDKTTIKLIKVNDGEMSVWKAFQKQP